MGTAKCCRKKLDTNKYKNVLCSGVERLPNLKIFMIPENTTGFPEIFQKCLKLIQSFKGPCTANLENEQGHLRPHASRFQIYSKKKKKSVIKDNVALALQLLTKTCRKWNTCTWVVGVQTDVATVQGCFPNN